MSDPINRSPAQEEALTFRSLYASPILRVSEYRCSACQGGPTTEEQSSSNNIVLMRQGVFRKHLGRRTYTADVNQVVFFSRDSVYRVSHPASCGDRGSVFTISPRVLNDIIRELDPYIDDNPDRSFPFVTSPCTAGIFLRHLEIAHRLGPSNGTSHEQLSTDELSLQLIAEVLKTAYLWNDRQPQRRPKTTTLKYGDRIDAAKAYIASKAGERITLEDIAKAVHISPFHLSRTFRQHVGLTLHGYLVQLRLRNSLQLLTDSAVDLMTLSIELGFSSHSHFSTAFRREFGLTPSEFRRRASHRLLRKLRKNLKV